MAIFKTSNATPSLEEIDVTKDNQFKIQVNTSGESVKGYSLQVWSGDGKDLLYETPAKMLSESEYVGNKELLSFTVTAIDFSSHGIVNGNNYLWGVRVYNELPNNLEHVSNTLVCEGYLVGSTKYVIWAKISKTDNEDALNQIVYDRYIEIEANKNDINIGGNPSDEERIKYKLLPDGPYRERRKIDWVEKELGTDSDYVKIELKDPFTYNYKNGTSFKIFKTSDEHTVTSAFCDPNSNINVSDWVIIYKSPEDAKKAANAGDTPKSTASGITPAFPAKKITGYSSDTGEIRVYDAWTSAPINGQAYRVFELDPDTQNYTEMLSSDLKRGATTGAKYYPTTVATGQSYYYRTIQNGVPSGKTWKYYPSYASCTAGVASDMIVLPNGVSSIAELYSAGSTGVSRFPIKNYRIKDGENVTVYSEVVPSGSKYYYDSSLGSEAGTTSGTLLSTLVSKKASRISIGGEYYYVRNSDSARDKYKVTDEYYTSATESFTGTLAYTFADVVNSALSCTNIDVIRAIQGIPAYTDAACTTLTTYLASGCYGLESGNAISYMVAEKIGDYYVKKYIKKDESRPSPGYMIETLQVLTSDLEEYNSTYGWLYNAARDDSSVYVGTTNETSYQYVNQTSSTITISNEKYNIFTPSYNIITDQSFYAVSGTSPSYGIITINDVQYYVDASDIIAKCGEDYISNPYVLQQVGGRAIYNDVYRVMNSNFTRATGTQEPNKLFIQPNVNIKTDILSKTVSGVTNYGIPNQLSIESTNGQPMRFSIVKQTRTDELGKDVDITFNKLDDTQWILEGNAIADASSSTSSLIPEVIPQTSYKVYTSFADTLPLNMFYARTFPSISFSSRNTYTKTGEITDSFKPMKKFSLTDVLCYRITPGAMYYPTVVEAGTPVYSDPECTVSAGTASSRKVITPYSFSRSGSSTYTYKYVGSYIDSVTNTARYITMGYGSTIIDGHEYPVLMTSISMATPSHVGNVIFTNKFLITSLDGVSICIPCYNYDDDETCSYGYSTIHKFTADENKYITYTMENYASTYVYAKTSLASMGRQIFYFTPPVYNYRDIEFSVGLSYPTTTNVESSHPSIKFYHYYLYDKNGTLIKESDDLYSADLTWRFSGLDEGDNSNGLSSDINYYTVKISITDEYNRVFGDSFLFGVYYPININETPLTIGFDCGEGATIIETEEPLYAISTDVDGISTVTSENIIHGDDNKSYVDTSDAVLNYDSVYKSDTETLPIYFPDTMSVLTQFRLSKETAYDLFSEAMNNQDINAESTVMSFGHSHVNGRVIEYHSNLATPGLPSVDYNVFMGGVKDFFGYDNDSEASGKYSLIKDVGKWYVEKIDSTHYDTALEDAGILFDMPAGHGLHSSDFMDFKMGTVDGSVHILTSGGYPLTAFRDNSNVGLTALTTATREKLENYIRSQYTGPGLDPIQNNRHFIMDYVDGNWRGFLSTTQISASGGYYVSLDDVGFVSSHPESSSIGDTLVLTKSSGSAIIANQRKYNSTFDIDVTGTTLDDNASYFIRKMRSNGGTSSSDEWFVFKITSATPVTFNTFSEYGFVPSFTHSTTYADDSMILSNDYMLVILKKQDGLVTASVISKLSTPSIFPIGSFSASMFATKVSELFPTAVESDLYTQYILTYVNGKLDVKKCIRKNDDISNPIAEETEIGSLDYVGITISSASGDNPVRDYIDVRLNTSEKLELRLSVPCKYFVFENKIYCNGYAGCFRLYDVSDPENEFLVSNCFVNDGNTPGPTEDITPSSRGTLLSYFSLDGAAKSSGANLVARELLKTPIQSNGGDSSSGDSVFTAIMSTEGYIYIRDEVGFNEDKVYIVTVEIPDEGEARDVYHDGAITPGIYGYNPSHKGTGSAGTFEKKSDALFVYIDGSEELPYNSRTNTQIPMSYLTRNFGYRADPAQQDPNRQCFVFCDKDETGADSLWIDYLSEPSINEFVDYDDTWIKLFMTVNNSYTGQSVGMDGNSRISIGIEAKKGGMW